MMARWSMLTGRLKLWLALAAPVAIGIAAMLIRKSGSDAERAKQAQPI